MTQQQEDVRARAQQMRDRVGEDYPDAWDYEEIPELVGIVQSIRRVDTDYGARAVATIREVDGAEKTWAVWLSVAALRNRFRELDIREGELVAIRYLGVGEPSRPGFAPPKRFRVEVDRSQGGSGFDWGAIDGDDDSGVGNRRVHEQPRRERVLHHDPAAGDAYDRPPIDDDIPF